MEVILAAAGMVNDFVSRKLSCPIVYIWDLPVFLASIYRSAERTTTYG